MRRGRPTTWVCARTALRSGRHARRPSRGNPSSSACCQGTSKRLSGCPAPGRGAGKRDRPAHYDRHQRRRAHPAAEVGQRRAERGATLRIFGAPGGQTDKSAFMALDQPLAVAPRDCVMVGGSVPSDLAGSRAANMRAVMADRDGTLPPLGVDTVRTLDHSHFAVALRRSISIIRAGRWNDGLPATLGSSRPQCAWRCSGSGSCSSSGTSTANTVMSCASVR